MRLKFTKALHTCRVIVACLLVGLLAYAIIAAARAASSRELTYQALNAALPTPADKAITLSPKDPEPYLARAVALLNAGEFDLAYKDYESAIALRPDDYQLWFRLGYAHYFAEDVEGAIYPFREAVQRAPYYAEPRWMLGKVLLAAGRREEAFRELRQAMSSNPVYTAEVINLAWDSYEGDTDRIHQIVDPKIPSARLALAISFVSHGEIDAAMRIVRQERELGGQDRKEFVTALLDASQFAEAYEAWSRGRGRSDLINNGSFEETVAADEQEFGWQFSRAVGQQLQFSRDVSTPYKGKFSLRVDFDGIRTPSLNLMSTLVVVQPESKYQLTWFARSKDLVTGGLPFIGINEASIDNQTLVESDTLPAGTSEWQNYRVEFSTGKATKAIYINLRRKSCSAGCPITGHLWLDDFSMKRLESGN